MKSSELTNSMDLEELPPSSGIWLRAVHEKSINILVEHAASIFRVKIYAKACCLFHAGFLLG
jgi:hypothetical protein